MMGYGVTFRGEPKGQVWKMSGRWRWERPAGKGIEPYSRGHGLIVVRRHIARLCGGIVADVKLTRKEIE